MFAEYLSANTPSSNAPGPKNDIALEFIVGGPVVYSYSKDVVSQFFKPLPCSSVELILSTINGTDLKISSFPKSSALCSPFLPKTTVQSENSSIAVNSSHTPTIVEVLFVHPEVPSDGAFLNSILASNICSSSDSWKNT